MSSCTHVYHLPFGSQIEYAWEVRTNGSDWQRCIPFYFSIHALHDTEHIDWWLPSLFTWTKTLAIHSYISTWIHYSASGFAQWIRTHGYHHTQSLHAPTKWIIRAKDLF
eukprot:720605_1